LQKDLKYKKLLTFSISFEGVLMVVLKKKIIMNYSLNIYQKNIAFNKGKLFSCKKIRFFPRFLEEKNHLI